MSAYSGHAAVICSVAPIRDQLFLIETLVEVIEVIHMKWIGSLITGGNAARFFGAARTWLIKKLRLIRVPDLIMLSHLI